MCRNGTEAAWVQARSSRREKLRCAFGSDLAGRSAFELIEHPGQVGLVDETRLVGDLGER